MNRTLKIAEVGERGYPSSRLYSIQVLRCISCIMVFLVHWGQNVQLDGILRKITNLGAYGPYLFFLISGFLAARTLSGCSVNAVEYYKKRALAILPLYYAIVLWLFASDSLLNRLHLIEIPPDKLHLGWLRYLFLLNGIIDSGSKYWTNLAGTWTIPVFAFFYLLAPWCLRSVSSARKALCIWLISLLLHLLLRNCYLNPHQCHSTIGNIHVCFLGVYLYWLTRQGQGVAASLAFGVGAIFMFAIGNVLYVHLMLFAVITLLSVSLEGSFSPSPIMRNIISYIDAHSYAFYLMHCVFIYCFVRRIMKGIPVWETGVIIILGSIAATWFGHNLIEKPIRRLFQRKCARADG